MQTKCIHPNENITQLILPQIQVIGAAMSEEQNGDKKPLRTTWGAGVLNYPPSKIVADRMRDEFHIGKYHYCRIRPGDPQTLVVMRTSNPSGLTQGSWDKMREKLGMRPPPECEGPDAQDGEEGEDGAEGNRPLGHKYRKRPLWRKFAEKYRDYRAAELEANYVVLIAPRELAKASGKENLPPQDHHVPAGINYASTPAGINYASVLAGAAIPLPIAPPPPREEERAAILPADELDRELPLPPPTPPPVSSSAQQTPTLPDPTLPDPTPPTLARFGAAAAPRSAVGKVKRSLLVEQSDAAEQPKGKRGRPRKSTPDVAAAARVPPPPEDILGVEQCAGILRGFFDFTTHFSAAPGGEQHIVHGLLKSVFAMMPRSMATDAQTARLFDPIVTADGLRFLPLLPHESTQASGVELHRRALALEQRVSQLLRLLRGVGADRLNAEDARDLDVAARCCDALDGTGVLPAPPPDSPTRAAGLHALLQAVHRARPTALKREILIADHVTWAVPVLLTLFMLRVEGRSDNAGLIKRRLEELNVKRDKALRHDTLPLRRYGWQLTVLARRLRQLMERATGGSPFQLSLAPPDFSNGRRALAFVREDPPTNVANEESLRRMHRENYTQYVSGAGGIRDRASPHTDERAAAGGEESRGQRAAVPGDGRHRALPRDPPVGGARSGRLPANGGRHALREPHAAPVPVPEPRDGRVQAWGVPLSGIDQPAGASHAGMAFLSAGGASPRRVIKAARFDCVRAYYSATPRILDRPPRIHALWCLPRACC
jgi:hypothetical protein